MRAQTPGNIGSAVAAGRRPEPLSERGRRTRAALIAGARAVFERDGFVNVRISDIAGEAGVAIGSFYTHFDSREEIFAAVLDDLQQDMLHPSISEIPDRDDPLAVIEAANRAYLQAYRRNARMNALMEEVAAIDEGFMLLRRARSDAFVRRNARSIRELQARGLADADLDPVLTADALSHMVSRMANRAFVQGRQVPFTRLVWTATRLWANALRIPVPEE